MCVVGNDDRNDESRRACGDEQVARCSPMLPAFESFYC